MNKQGTDLEYDTELTKSRTKDYWRFNKYDYPTGLSRKDPSGCSSNSRP